MTNQFSREAAKLSRKIAEVNNGTLQNKQEYVKPPNRGEGYCFSAQIKPPFCKAVFACNDKIKKKVYGKHGGRRRYQMCGFSDTCNQQTNVPMFLQLEEANR